MTKDTLLEIKSLEHRMNNPMTLDEAEKFNAELFKKNFDSSIETNKVNYKFEIDELMEYLLLRKEKTGLPVECYADDGGSFKIRKHPLWFLMKNGYGNTHDVVPFTVDGNPRIVGNYKLNVSQTDINKVISFIIQNRNKIIALGNDDIDNIEFLNTIDTFQYKMAESISRERIDEMAKIRSRHTGLPTDIWVDEDMLYVEAGHSQRMKFNAIQGNKDTHFYTAMTINDNPPKVIKKPRKTFLDSKDIDKIRKFVIANREILLLLGDKKITFDEFFKQMIKV